MAKEKCRPELVEGQQAHENIVRVYLNNCKEIEIPILDKSEFGVYILMCRDKSLYVGHSSNMGERISRHIKGEGSEYTKKKRPVQLIYCEVYNNETIAIRREKQLKGWGRKKKFLLISGQMNKNI